MADEANGPPSCRFFTLVVSRSGQAKMSASSVLARREMQISNAKWAQHFAPAGLSPKSNVSDKIDHETVVLAEPQVKERGFEYKVRP